MHTKIAAALAFAASVAALHVEYPAKDSELDLTKQNTITWSSVNTDPSSFDIYIVNNAIYPSVRQLVASNVETSKGSYNMDSVNVPANKGYQIDLESDNPQNTGILAQSEQFVVVSAGSSTTSASATGTTATIQTSSPTTSASITTITSTSGGSSSSSSSSSSASGSSSSGSSTASSGTANASSASTPTNAAAANMMSISTGAGSLLLGLFALLM